MADDEREDARLGSEGAWGKGEVRGAEGEVRGGEGCKRERFFANGGCVRRSAHLSDESLRLVPLDEPKSRSCQAPPATRQSSACIAETDWSGKQTSLERARPMLMTRDVDRSSTVGADVGAFRLATRRDALPSSACSIHRV